MLYGRILYTSHLVENDQKKRKPKDLLLSRAANEIVLTVGLADITLLYMPPSGRFI